MTVPKNYNALKNTYRDLPIQWANIQDFQMMFLEAQCELNEVGLMIYNLEKETPTLSTQAINSRKKEIAKKREEVRQTLIETYLVVWGIRAQLKKLYEESPEYKAAIDKKCKDDPVLWINSFAWTFDPRLTNLKVPAKLPLVLFPKQAECIRKVDQCMEENRPYMIEKSRAEGLTEILCALDVHHWIYLNGYKVTWGSRTEDMVDKHGDPDTIFVRLRRIIYNLPEGMTPPAFKHRNNPYDNLMRIVNPLNGNAITGGGGINIARGGRATNIRVDEAAALENPQAVDEAISYATNCQGDISTPNGMNHFYKKITSGKVERITMGWWFNPTKNPEWATGNRAAYSPWYELEKLKKDEVVIAKEVDINYQASVEGVMIPGDWVNAAIEFDIPVDETVKVGAFDPAAGGKDDAVYGSRTGVRIDAMHVLPSKTPLETTWDAVELAEKDDIKLFAYDRNAIGEDVYPLLTKGDRRVNFKLSGIYGQSAASDTYIEAEDRYAKDKFRNRRGELWWNLRTRFQKTYLHRKGIEHFPLNELISIPNDPDLITELSSPLLVHSASGKIGVESKKEMKRRGVQSPGRADVASYLFADDEDSAEVVDEFGYHKESTITPMGYDKTAPHEVFVSVWMTEDQRLFVLPVQYIFNSQVVRVFAEKIFDSLNPKEVYDWVREVMDNQDMPISGWIGNDKVFEGLLEGRLTTWYDFRKANIPIEQNYRRDFDYSIAVLNEMFKKDLLQINDQCHGTSNHIRNWRMKKGKPDAKMFYGEALAQVVPLLRDRKMIIRAEPPQRERKVTYS